MGLTSFIMIANDGDSPSVRTFVQDTEGKIDIPYMLYGTSNEIDKPAAYLEWREGKWHVDADTTLASTEILCRLIPSVYVTDDVSDAITWALRSHGRLFVNPSARTQLTHLKIDVAKIANKAVGLKESVSMNIRTKLQQFLEMSNGARLWGWKQRKNPKASAPVGPGSEDMNMGEESSVDRLRAALGEGGVFSRLQFPNQGRKNTSTANSKNKRVMRESTREHVKHGYEFHTRYQPSKRVGMARYSVEGGKYSSHHDKFADAAASHSKIRASHPHSYVVNNYTGKAYKHKSQNESMDEADRPRLSDHGYVTSGKLLPHKDHPKYTVYHGKTGKFDHFHKFSDAAKHHGETSRNDRRSFITNNRNGQVYRHKSQTEGVAESIKKGDKVRVTVKKVDDEWQAVVYVNGKYSEEQTYFSGGEDASYKQDATSTAADLRKRFAKMGAVVESEHNPNMNSFHGVTRSGKKIHYPIPKREKAITSGHLTNSYKPAAAHAKNHKGFTKYDPEDAAEFHRERADYHHGEHGKHTKSGNHILAHQHDHKGRVHRALLRAHTEMSQSRSVTEATVGADVLGLIGTTYKGVAVDAVAGNKLTTDPTTTADPVPCCYVSVPIPDGEAEDIQMGWKAHGGCLSYPMNNAYASPSGVATASVTFCDKAKAQAFVAWYNSQGYKDGRRKLWILHESAIRTIRVQGSAAPVSEAFRKFVEG